MITTTMVECFEGKLIELFILVFSTNMIPGKAGGRSGQFTSGYGNQKMENLTFQLWCAL